VDIWWLKPAAWVLALGPVRAVAEQLYAAIAGARARHACTQDACGTAAMPPAAEADHRHLIGRRTVADVKVAIYAAFIGICLITQGLCLLETPWLAARTASMRALPMVHTYRRVMTVLLGLHPHAVFMDYRFGQTHHYLLTAVHVDAHGHETWLPIFLDTGQAAQYTTGRLNVHWLHRVITVDVDVDQWDRGLRRITAFWSRHHGVDLDDATFLIKIKRIDTSQGWEPGYRQRQMAMPWMDGGVIRWRDQHYTSQVVDVIRALDSS